jgi:hypothetical protein
MYDTRINKDQIRRFPIQGWFFPCFDCGTITGYIKIIYLKGIIFKKYMEVPCCLNCKVDESKLNLSKVIKLK